MRVIFSRLTLAIGLATAFTVITAHAAEDAGAVDGGLVAALESGDFKGWRESLNSRINAASARDGLSSTELQTLDLDLARHEFLLQTMAGDKLSAAVRPGEQEAASGKDALAAIATTRDGRAFLNWLLNDREALGNYLDCTFFSNAESDRTYGLGVWRKIWESDPESHQGLWCRVAAAFAVTYGRERVITETAWDQKIDRVLDPVERYVFYRTSFEEGRLASCFATAPAWEMVYTVHGSFRSIDELRWAQQMLPPEKFTQRGAANMEYQIVKYRMGNYRDSSVFGTGYFDGKADSLMEMAEYGSICVGISHAGVCVATSAGIPAFTIGQPYHCAFISKASPRSWEGGNFVSGWKKSYGALPIKYFGCAYSVNVRLLSRAFTHPDFRESEMLRRLANVKLEANDRPAALNCLDKASKLCPVNFLARSAMVKLLLESDGPDAVNRLRQECVNLTRDLADFPMAGEAIRREAEATRLNTGLAADQKAAYLAQIAAGLASSPASRQAGLGTKAFAVTFTRQLATFGVKAREADRVIEAAVDPIKPKPGETTPPVPAMKAPARADELVRYLNALAAATDVREAFATAVTSIVSALPENVRASVTLKPSPNPDIKPAAYDAKTFAKVGSWTRDTVGGARLVTEGWRELEIQLPAAERHAGQLTIAFVQANGDPISFENLRLFADGTEVDTDDQALTLKGPRKPGLFGVEIKPAFVHARLTLKVIVSDVPPDKVNDGEIRILEPVVQTARK